MKTNYELRQDAKTSLKGHWWDAILPVLLYFLLCGAFVTPGYLFPGKLWLSGGLTLVEVLLVVPIAVGFFNAYHIFATFPDDNVLANILRTGFGNYAHNLLGYLLYDLIVVAFGCLLIVPGVIASLMYAMVPYILVENPELSLCETLKKSRMMMKGHKMDLFLILLGFVGLSLLSVLTLFVALLWLIPYYYTVLGHFYESLKQDSAVLE